MNTPWSDRAIRAEFDRDFHSLVDFARFSVVDTGFGYMGPDGTVDASRPVELWITCRMTHVFCLAALQGVDGAAEFADHGIASLTGPFADDEHGGWYSGIGHYLDDEGKAKPVEGTRKEAYAHAFVVLAATSAVAAGRPGAQDLLDQALAAQDAYWWEPEFGRVRESWDLAFTQTEDYRGLNANMHPVECDVSAFDVTGQRKWLDRARGILRFVYDRASEREWRIPEHYTSQWDVLPDYNRDQPAHPFRPYGVTPGHGLEWARLMLQARAALLALGDTPGEWMLDGAISLFDAAVADGWDVDGAPGFIYTTDFDGQAVVRERMHWVLCEAVAAGVVLGKILQDQGEREDRVRQLSEEFAVWVTYADEYIRSSRGRWIHELTPDNTPGTRTWPGKPDAYHVAQMLLLPRLPVTPTFASALKLGLLEPIDLGHGDSDEGLDEPLEGGHDLGEPVSPTRDDVEEMPAPENGPTDASAGDGGATFDDDPLEPGPAPEPVVDEAPEPEEEAELPQVDADAQPRSEGHLDSEDVEPPAAKAPRARKAKTAKAPPRQRANPGVPSPVHQVFDEADEG